MQIPIASMVAVLCGLLTCALCRALAWRWRVVDHPNPIVPQHTRPVAYLGGVGIAGGAIAAAIVFEPGREWLLRHRGDVVLPAALMLAAGTVDDVRALSPAKKLLLQGLVAAMAVVVGARHGFTGAMWLDAILSWFWIVTVVNAFNLTDVCDGLVGGLGAIAFVAIALLFPEHAFPALIAAGACVGFLAFNLPDATMFLGDGGSHLLGALVATLLLTTPDAHGAAHAVPMLLIAGVPLFELVFLVVVRMRKGLKWWRGSPDHLALRLQRAGLSKLRTDAVAWSAAAGLAALAAVARHSAGEPLITISLLAFLAASSWMAGRFLVWLEARA